MAYVTEQVKRVQSAMYQAGYKRGEFSAKVEREYKGRVDGRAIYEYGRLALVIYTTRLDTPETARKLVESGEVNAELHLTYNKKHAGDESYRLSMRFTASSAYRGKYRLYKYNSLSPRIAEDERFSPFDSFTIDFNEFNRIWQDWKDSETVEINEHRFELRFTHFQAYAQDARVKCEVVPLDWNTDASPVIISLGASVEESKRKALDYLRGEQVVILCDDYAVLDARSTSRETIERCLVLYKGARFIACRWRLRTVEQLSLEVLCHPKAAPYHLFTYSEDKLLTDRYSGQMMRVGLVAALCYRSRRADFRSFADYGTLDFVKRSQAADELIEKTLAEHLYKLIDEQRDKQRSRL